MGPMAACIILPCVRPRHNVSVSWRPLSFNMTRCAHRHGVTMSPNPTLMTDKATCTLSVTKVRCSEGGKLPRFTDCYLSCGSTMMFSHTTHMMQRRHETFLVQTILSSHASVERVLPLSLAPFQTTGKTVMCGRRADSAMCTAIIRRAAAMYLSPALASRICRHLCIV